MMHLYYLTLSENILSHVKFTSVQHVSTKQHTSATSIFHTIISYPVIKFKGQHVHAHYHQENIEQIY